VTQKEIQTDSEKDLAMVILTGLMMVIKKLTEIPKDLMKD
jgi:hypothetical protein